MANTKIKTSNPKSDYNSSNSSFMGNLYRSESNRIIAGVCGGLGEYFNIDPIIFRIIFILVTVFGGSGILIYIILWLIMPSASSSKKMPEEHIKENAAEMKLKAEKFAHDIRNRSSNPGDNSRSWWPLLLILLGIIFLLKNFGYLYYFDLERLWPIFIIILGLLFLLRGDKN